MTGGHNALAQDEKKPLMNKTYPSTLSSLKQTAQTIIQVAQTCENKSKTNDVYTNKSSGNQDKITEIRQSYDYRKLNSV